MSDLEAMDAKYREAMALLGNPTWEDMTDKIAEAWQKHWGENGVEGVWTGKAVFESDPNGELFWIPGEYLKALCYLDELPEAAK